MSGLQVATEKAKDPGDRFLDTIFKQPKKEFNSPNGNNYYMITEDVGENYYTIFKDYQFPKEIALMTKEDEWNYLVNHDAKDLADLTWFCHYPIDGQPCGYCKPCRATVAELGEFRLPEPSLKRYRHWRFYLAMHKIKKGFQLIGSFFKK